MINLNTIANDLKNVPADRLEDLYSFVKFLSVNKPKSKIDRNKILSFSGSFADMSEEDFQQFLNEAKNVRANLFDREVEL